MKLLWIALVLAFVGCDSREPSSGDPTIDGLRAALERFQTADTSPRKVPHARIDEAREHMQAKRWEEARAVLEPLTLQATSNLTDEASFLLGIVHHESHRPALAMPLFERVLARGPTFPAAAQAFYFSGKALAELGAPEAARVAFEADRTLFPTSGDPWFQLALLDAEAGRAVEARAQFGEALARFTTRRDRAKVHARLGDLALAADDLEGAEQSYRACVELFPHYEVYYKLAGVARSKGDDDAAEEYERLHADLRARAAAGAPGLEDR